MSSGGLTDVNRNEIEVWMKDYAAKTVGIDPTSIDLKKPLERYGLDSTAVAGLSGELSNVLGIEIDPSLLYDYPTISSAAEHISTMQG